jgi:hypothetical protein
MVNRMVKNPQFLQGGVERPKSPYFTRNSWMALCGLATWRNFAKKKRCSQFAKSNLIATKHIQERSRMFVFFFHCSVSRVSFLGIGAKKLEKHTHTYTARERERNNKRGGRERNACHRCCCRAHRATIFEETHSEILEEIVRTLCC